MSINYSFKGKKVLVTGGGQGIGRSIVQKFHDGGAKVYTVDKNPTTVHKLREELPGVQAEIIDITDWEATSKIIESWGPINHLVNNAGMQWPQNILDVTKEAFNLLFDVNVLAAINVTKAVAKGLIDASMEGSVVNICSIGGREANPIGLGVYCSTKAALENLTKTMALELGSHQIRVNCVVPGGVNTPMQHDIGPDGANYIKNTVLPRTIAKRLVEPEEIADAVMFLLSPLSKMIIGESLAVDGGYLAC